MIINKPINKNITSQEVNKDYKLILEFVKKNKDINKNLSFKDFNDYELFIYSIIDTYNFGRSFKESVNNALSHLGNKEGYIKLLTTPDIEENFI